MAIDISRVTYGWVLGDGPDDAELMLVGEAPAKNEIRTGKPFQGQAGQYLDSVLELSGMPPRDTIYITNLIKVPVTDNTSDDEMSQHIRDWEEILRCEIESVKPRVIASLGAWSTKWFLHNYSPGYPDTGDMDWLHGIPRLCTTPSGHSFTLVPCFHPAAGLHDGDSIPHIFSDIKVVLDTLQGRVQLQAKRPPTSVVVEDNPFHLIASVQEADHLAFDTEGYPGDVKMASWSHHDGLGMVVRTPDWLALLVKVLQDYKGVLIGHNLPWDLKVLASIGLDLYNLRCKLVDTMQMAKYMNTEPGGLKKLAWRLLGLEMDEYADLIRPIQRELTIGYLEMIGTLDYPKPESEMLWKNGTVKMYTPQYINRYTRRILGDERVRQMAVDVWGPMPEATLDHVDIDLANTYSGTDAIATRLIYWELKRRFEERYGR